MLNSFTAPTAAPTAPAIPNLFTPGDFKNPNAAFLTFVTAVLESSMFASFCADPTGSCLIIASQVSTGPPKTFPIKILHAPFVPLTFFIKLSK